MGTGHGDPRPRARSGPRGLCTDTHRKHSRWGAVMHLAADTSRSSADMSPDTIAADRADIHAALAHLTPRERACVVLRHFEDMTVREIAGHLDLSEGAVKRYLHDAHQRLHPLLGADDTTDIEIISKGARR
jgi:RNA polymerase sigma factor (sigma-70 family)